MSQSAVVNFAPDPGSVEIREIDFPEPETDEVIVKVEAVGVCGSDIHQWHSTHSWPVNYPVVLKNSGPCTCLPLPSMIGPITKMRGLKSQTK